MFQHPHCYCSNKKLLMPIIYDNKNTLITRATTIWIIIDPAINFHFNGHFPILDPVVPLSPESILFQPRTDKEQETSPFFHSCTHDTCLDFLRMRKYLENSLLLLLLLFLFLLFKVGFLSVALALGRTDLELAEICLPLSPQCRD